MLQIAPATKNIAVIVGATPLEHVGRRSSKRQPSHSQTELTSPTTTISPLTKCCSGSPSCHQTPIFSLLLLLRDASGVTRNADEALQRLHQVANAPINSIFIHQLGLGIVGGRLTRPSLWERKLRTSPFGSCTANPLPVFRPNQSTVFRRVMTGARSSDGTSMKNSCRREARSCSARRQFGIGTGRGS